MYWEILAFLGIVALACVLCLGMIAVSTRKSRYSRHRRAALRKWMRSETSGAPAGNGRVSVRNPSFGNPS
jgi:hypothetical protein